MEGSTFSSLLLATTIRAKNRDQEINKHGEEVEGIMSGLGKEESDDRILIENSVPLYLTQEF